MPSNPNEHLQIPHWVNEHYFERILEKDVDDFAKIQSFDCIAATAPGDNYTSIMVRVFIDYQSKDGNTTKKSYILKTSFEEMNQGAIIIKSMNLFPKEKFMYETVLPYYTKLYKDVNMNIQFGPRCVHVEETPERITLVLEDLSERHFKNANRLEGFDLEHMTHLLCKLAELHAASTIYYELNETFPEYFDKGLYTESNREMFVSLGKARKPLYIKAMHQWNLENVEEYIEKMGSDQKFFNECLKATTVNPKEFNVMNHGDVWVNNVMFNYMQNGSINETALVDFQVGIWGSPALDLWYMITTSASLDIKVTHYDRFIKIYHDRLIECLKALNYTKPMPTLKELHIAMLEKGYWSYIVAAGVMVAVLLPSDKDANMENMLKNSPEQDEFKYRTFINPYYARAMCQLLPFLKNKGIL